MTVAKDAGTSFFIKNVCLFKIYKSQKKVPGGFPSDVQSVTLLENRVPSHFLGNNTKFSGPLFYRTLC